MNNIDVVSVFTNKEEIDRVDMFYINIMSQRLLRIHSSKTKSHLLAITEENRTLD